MFTMLTSVGFQCYNWNSLLLLQVLKVTAAAHSPLAECGDLAASLVPLSGDISSVSCLTTRERQWDICVVKDSLVCDGACLQEGSWPSVAVFAGRWQAPQNHKITTAAGAQHDGWCVKANNDVVSKLTIGFTALPKYLISRLAAALLGAN